MCEKTIEEFFEDGFFCEAEAKDDKKMQIIRVKCINRSKDFSSFDKHINNKVEKLKEKRGETIDCDLYWEDHHESDDLRIAKIRIYYEDYDE